MQVRQLTLYAMYISHSDALIAYATGTAAYFAWLTIRLSYILVAACRTQVMCEYCMV